MILIIVAMSVVILLALIVVGYVAFPYRGEDLPLVPGAGRWMRRQLDELPTTSDEDTPLGHR